MAGSWPPRTDLYAVCPAVRRGQAAGFLENPSALVVVELEALQAKASDQLWMKNLLYVDS